MNPKSNACWAPRPVEAEPFDDPQFAEKDIQPKAMDRCTDTMARLLDCLQVLKVNRFTGFIDIHYDSGSLERVEQYEEIFKNLSDRNLAGC